MSTPRNIVLPIAIIAGLAVIVVLLFATCGGEEEPEDVEAAGSESAGLEDAFDEPAPTTAEPETADGPKAAPRPSAQLPAAPEPAPPPAPAVAEEETPAPITPEVRRHAKLMAIGTAQYAMEHGDIARLREVVALSKDEDTQFENLVAHTDIEAIEIAMACLQGEPDAQKRAAAFLQYGPRSQLDDGLRKVCWEKLGTARQDDPPRQ